MKEWRSIFIPILYLLFFSGSPSSVNFAWQLLLSSVYAKVLQIPEPPRISTGSAPSHTDQNSFSQGPWKLAVVWLSAWESLCLSLFFKISTPFNLRDSNNEEPVILSICIFLPSYFLGKMWRILFCLVFIFIFWGKYFVVCSEEGGGTLASMLVSTKNSYIVILPPTWAGEAFGDLVVVQPPVVPC